MHKTVISITRISLVGLVAIAAAACEAEKSRNPLSPNVAGPIAGVSLSVPTPATPVNGSEVLNTQPVRLTFNNSSSNGERPFWYIVELAVDPGFTNKVFAHSRVMPTGGNQTSIVVDGTLTAERTYYWRVKADDGANESEFSAAARFDLVVPIVIEAPAPVSPVAGAAVSSTTPVLTVTNGGLQGRTGNVQVLVRGRPRSGLRANARSEGRRSRRQRNDQRADARAAGQHAALLARGRIQWNAHGSLVGGAELPDTRGRAGARTSARARTVAGAGTGQRLQRSRFACELVDRAVARVLLRDRRGPWCRTDRIELGNGRDAGGPPRARRGLAERLARRLSSAGFPAGSELPASVLTHRSGLLVQPHGRRRRCRRCLAVDTAVEFTGSRFRVDEP